MKTRIHVNQHNIRANNKGADTKAGKQFSKQPKKIAKKTARYSA